MAKLWNKIKKFGSDNSPQLLLAAELCGLAATVVATYTAAPECERIIKDAKKKMREIPKEHKEERRAVVKDAAKEIIPKVLPIVIAAGATSACIIGSYKATSKKIALLTTAYQLSERALDATNKKMVDILGEKKAKEVKDAIVKDRFDKNPPNEGTPIIATGNGTCKCQDCFSGRVFETSPEKVNQAVLELSHQCIAEDYVSINDLYYLLGLKDIPAGGDFGWSSSDLDGRGRLPIAFTSILGPNNEPYLCIDYDVHLRDDYRYARGF